MRDKNEQLVDKFVAAEKKKKDYIAAYAFKKQLEYKVLRKKLERTEAEMYRQIELYRNGEREFDLSPISEVPDDVKLPDCYFDEVSHKREYNTTYADYYWQCYEDTNNEKYLKMSQRILTCHKMWFGDRYKASGVFNVKRVFHCHNRWCWLCNHLKQAKRLMKYHVKFEKLLKKYDLYHIVFTVKNVKGNELEDTIERMHNALYTIIRRFQGRGKITGIDFSKYGFVGAIRSFEIVIDPTEYHPHIHALFLLNKGLELDYPKKIINKFSFSDGILKRKYSEFEVLLQKLFYLAYNKQKLNLKNIDELKLGYSCTVDHIEDDSNNWHEVFKYATKMSKDGASACTYEQFVFLDDIFRRMKFIQNYGIFLKSDEPDPELDPFAEILFQKVLVLLDRREDPDRDVSMEINELVDEVHNKNLTVISKKMSYKLMKSYYDDLQAECQADNDFPF